MTDSTNRTAQTDAPILDVLKERWSPRSFTSEPVTDAELRSMLEAARWSPSAANTQPSRFIVGVKGGEVYERAFDTLLEGNRPWAKLAPVIVIGVAKSTSDTGRELPHAVYDLGQAVAHLSVQAHSLGLFVHQMAGFSPEAVRESFGLADDENAIVAMVIGHVGAADQLDEPYRERESSPRERKTVAELLLASDLH